MPRVENCGPAVDAFCRSTGEGASTHDICADCAQDLIDDPHGFNDKLVTYNGAEQGELGWADEDCPHPPYEGEDYRCAICNVRLTEDDD